MQSNTPRGRFIVVEGPNGAGKGTLLDLIEAELRAEGYDVERTREPGGSELAELLRPIAKGCRGKVTDFAAALLFNTARADNCAAIIRPALAAGKFVLCDRWNLSTKVFQDLLGQLSPTERAAVNLVHAAHQVPDMTVVVLPTAETLQSRTGGIVRDGDSFETIGHAREVEAYRKGAEEMRHSPQAPLIIDVGPDDSPEAVASKVFESTTFRKMVSRRALRFVAAD